MAISSIGSASANHFQTNVQPAAVKRDSDGDNDGSIKGADKDSKKDTEKAIAAAAVTPTAPSAPSATATVGSNIDTTA